MSDFTDVDFVRAPRGADAPTSGRGIDVAADLQQALAPPMDVDAEVRKEPPPESIEIAPDI